MSDTGDWLKVSVSGFDTPTTNPVRDALYKCQNRMSQLCREYSQMCISHMV